MKEQMRKAFLEFMSNDHKFTDGYNLTESVFNAGYQAALSAVPENHIGDGNEMVSAGWQRRLKFSTNGQVHQWESCKTREAVEPFENSPAHEYRQIFAMQSQAQQPAQDTLQKQLNEMTRRHDQQVRTNKLLIKAWKEAQQPAQEPVCTTCQKVDNKFCSNAFHLPVKQEPLNHLELRDFLECMQHGEMTVSRGLEILKMWIDGKYSDDELPDYSNQPSLTEQLANAMQMHADITAKYIALCHKEPVKPTEQQILAATEKAGLWPNTVYTWLPAFHRYHAELAKLNQEPVKQESWISVDDVQSLVDASEIVMKWLVKNVHQWNFSEYDWLNSATERVKASLPPVKEVTD